MDKLSSCLLVLARVFDHQLLTTILVHLNSQYYWISLFICWLGEQLLIPRVLLLGNTALDIFFQPLRLTAIVALPLSLQGFVPLAFHFFEEFFIIREALLIDYFANFSFHAASNHPIDGILFSLNSLLGFSLTIGMDLGVKR